MLEEEAGECGDGSLDPPGEECDDGNTLDGDCCSSTCQYESVATECRAAAGVCDAPDYCDGAGTCDADGKLTSECRAVGGPVRHRGRLRRREQRLSGGCGRASDDRVPGLHRRLRPGRAV
ncbi:MAG: hypothetical protein GWN93_19715 [Deltaproteobacteria bacterium]|nr:hypothetical protein [Deltaproteobacteria bacterium]